MTDENCHDNESEYAPDWPLSDRQDRETRDLSRAAKAAKAAKDPVPPAYGMTEQ